MAKHSVQAASSADPNVTTTVSGPTSVASMPGSEGVTVKRKRGGPTGPKGPALTWSDASGANPSPRDIALVQTIRANAGVNADGIAAALQSHDAFKGELSPITAGKVRQRVKQLQKQGVNIPAFARGGGGGKRYTVDASSLNALLQ